MRKRVLVTGGAGFIGSHLTRRLLGDGPRGARRRQLLLEQTAQHRGSARRPALRIDAARRDVPALRRGRRDLPPGLSRLADLLPARSGADDQDVRARLDQHARPGQANRAPDPARVDVGGVRRSGRASAGRVVLGQRQPGRAALVLRRGQALRRDAVLRLLPSARAADQGRAHLQHLRAAHAAGRRTGRLELHRLRRCRAPRSPSSATGRRPARSAMSTTWSTV